MKMTPPWHFMVLVLLVVALDTGDLAAGQAITPEIKVILAKLQQLLKTPQQSKGTPFTPLNSQPKPHHRVAIIGAGIAGLHMAYLLKKKGFRNVVVLEKDSRVGGKLLSVKHRGFYHELGACYTSPDYRTNVYALAKELGIKDFVSIALNSRSVWLDNRPPMPYRSYLIMEVMRLTKAKTPTEATKNLVDAIYRYSKLHREMFGRYDGELMPKPSKEVLAKLDKTILSFLTEHKLLALAPVFQIAHTMQGYGHIDETSALYAMMWDTPNFLSGLLANSLNGATFSEMFRNGFMQLTDKLAPLVNVRLNINIQRIKRTPSCISITYNRGRYRSRTEHFDFLIWAADAREALKVLEQPTAMEKCFSRMTNKWFTSTLFDSTEACAPSPIETWLSNLAGKREHSVWARRTTRFIMTRQTCDRKSGKRNRLSSISYQMGSYSPRGNEVRRKFSKHFVSGVKAQRVKVVKSTTWNYFPRFSVKQMADGILWKIAERQGEKNTWFIGSSTSLESVKSVMEYNTLMMKRMGL